MEWKSNAQGGTPLECGTIFTLKSPARVVIHKYHGCGDALFLSCPTIGIEKENLNTEDFNCAVKKAQHIVRMRLNKLLDDYAPFAADEAESKLVRY